VDGADGAVDGGRADLREFDGDAGLDPLPSPLSLTREQVRPLDEPWSLAKRPRILIGVLNGLLAEANQQPRRALDWIIQCVTLLGQFPPGDWGRAFPPGPVNPPTGHASPGTSWQQITGHPLPQPVRDYITSHRDEEPAGEP